MTVQTARPKSHRGPQGPRRRRGLSFYVGLVLVLVGLGLLGYVGWQFYGTNVVAKQAQQRAVADLEQEWHGGAAAPVQEEEPTTEPTPAHGKPMALIKIPRFGDDYVMPVLHGVEDKQLSSGFGHFPEAALPGERGNFALAAHRVTHGEPLRDMPKLRPGDEVVVETRQAVYTYELDTNPNDLVVTFADVWVIDPKPVNPDKDGVQPPDQPELITLTTCSELFHTDNRMISFGHLVDTEPKRPQ